MSNYFVKYSVEDNYQPLRRVHVNCNLTIPEGTTNWWEIVELLRVTEFVVGKDLVIDFMIKMGEDNA